MSEIIKQEGSNLDETQYFPLQMLVDAQMYNENLATAKLITEERRKSLSGLKESEQIMDFEDLVPIDNLKQINDNNEKLKTLMGSINTVVGGLATVIGVNLAFAHPAQTIAAEVIVAGAVTVVNKSENTKRKARTNSLIAQAIIKAPKIENFI